MSKCNIYARITTRTLVDAARYCMTAYLADALDKRAETGCHRCSTQTDEGKEVDAAYDTCAGCINYRHCRTHPCSAGCTDDCCPGCIRRPG